jgi:hypothetical protein
MKRTAVAVMGEGGSSVVIRGVQYGSGLNQEDLGGLGINSSSILLSCMFPAQTWKTNQETSRDHHSSTYVIRGVRVEGRIMDDQSSINNADGSTNL